MDDLETHLVADHLTPRELEILRLMADGLSNQAIAGRLFITLGTAKWYLRQIYAKLQVNSRTQAIAAARSRGLFDTKPAHVEMSVPGNNLPQQFTTFVGRTEE